MKTIGENKDLIELPKEEQQKLFSLSKDLSVERIDKVFLAFSGALGDLKQSLDPQLLIETICLSVAEKIEEQNCEEDEHKIWGKVLTELFEKNVVAHSAVSNLSNVKLSGNDFLINFEDISIYEVMKKTENYNDLVACFKKLGYNYNVLLKMIKTETEDKEKLLSEKIGIKVDVKGE